MKKFIPLIVAVVAFVLVLVMMQPPPQMTVVVAARDLSRGHIVRENDIRMAEFPAEMIPADAVTDPVMLVGESLVMDRTEVTSSRWGISANRSNYAPMNAPSRST